MRRVGPALAVCVALAILVGGCSGSGNPAAQSDRSSPTNPAATTSTTEGQLVVPAGNTVVANPLTSPLTYSSTPGGPSAGTLATLTWGDPSVRPVVSQSGNFVQIALDTRPNGSTGWVPRSAVTLAVTAYRIHISVSQRRISLYRSGQQIYSARIGVGAPQWPTPLGTTFVDAIVATPKNQLYIYGPTVLVLGTHSNVFTDFDGGDGTVAIHGYPSDPGTTNGVAVTHGCIRANPATIDALKVVPLGTPVDIVA